MPGTPDILGYQPDSASANGRNAYWFFDQWLAPSGQPQVLLPGARTQRRWLEFRGTGWTDRVRLKLFATGAETSTVPAVAPDTVPHAFIATLPIVADSAGRQLRTEIVIVSFLAGTTQQMRQAAVDAVAGEVIGGVPEAIDEGAYYIRVRSAISASKLHDAFGILMSLPQVAVVYLIDTANPPLFPTGAEVPAVPAAAPDTLPPGLINSLPNVTDSANRTLKSQIVLVEFREGTSQLLRQAAVDEVSGQVIGGMRVPIGEGLYYLRIPTATTASRLHDAYEVLQALPQVGIVYFLDAVPPSLEPNLPSQQLKRFNPGAEVAAVPATAPDTLPPGLINSLPDVTDGAKRTLKTQIVLVKFREGTSQSLRQAAVDAVSGEVIGGIRVPVGEGVYYLRIRTATTAGRLHNAFGVLHAMRQVALVYLLDAVPPDVEPPVTSADVPAIPAIAPDSLPRKLLVESRVVTPSHGFPYFRDILIVSFRLGTSLSERTRVLARVAATVVGGFPNTVFEGGTYVILLPSDSTQSTLKQAEALLSNESSVHHVNRYYAVNVGITSLRSSGVPAPSEVSLVPAVAPDSIPSGLFADSNLVEDPDLPGVRYVKRVVSVLFKATATAADRQAAVAVVGGVVIGGVRISGSDGYYLIRLASDTSIRGPKNAVALLESLPAVEQAFVERVSARPMY